MNIAIVGYEKERRDNLETHLRACLEQDADVNITQYEMNKEHINLERPPVPCAVFVIIDEETALLDAKKVSSWGKGFPMVMVATHPQYAIEGIRQKVKHYILFPLDRGEITEALKRTGAI